ncbi:MAG: peptidase M15 [Phenylobacterium zucineum]|nr:MAG: peptidase M15 [Phenylobacterium zucineum]
MIEHARRLLAAIGFGLALAAAGVVPKACAESAFLQTPTIRPQYAAIVVDAANGEVLYAKRADSLRYPASITKVMTLYLTFEALSTGQLKLDDEVAISPHAAAQGPTKLGLPVGDRLTVSEAMQALAIKSANDIAVALAETLGGTESRFAAMMTLKAQDLGMTNTNFVNASGLPDSRQVSTARDIAILSRAVMRDYPQYYRLFSQQRFTFRGTTMNNHNGLLGRMQGVDGLKTGFTNASGYNLAVSAVRDNRRIVTVVLGGPSNALRDQTAERLMLTGFDIMTRRDRGEKIMVAQNLFEPPPVTVYAKPSTVVTDTPERVVFTSAPVPTRLAKFQLVDPKTTALHVSPRIEAKLEGKGPWAIQVGAFNSRKLAEIQVEAIRRRFSALVRATLPRVDNGGGNHWKAQFKGFDEVTAHLACKSLKRERQACMVVDPSEGQSAALPESFTPHRLSADLTRLAEQSVAGGVDLRR